MHDELVEPEVRCDEAEAAFGALDSRNSFCVFGRGEMGLLKRGHAFLYQAIARVFTLGGEGFIEEDVKRPGQSKTAVNVLFLDKFLDRLDVSDFVVGDLGCDFQTVFVDVIRHAVVDFWSKVGHLDCHLHQSIIASGRAIDTGVSFLNVAPGQN